MIVVDTSAWVEFLRETDGPADRALQELVGAGAELAVTEVVVMEVLSGARSPRHLRALRAELSALPVLPLGGARGYEAAAELYRACRHGGETIRSLLDCLVAVPAIEADAPVLHADRDFDTLARHTPLQVVSLDG